MMPFTPRRSVDSMALCDRNSAMSHPSLSGMSNSFSVMRSYSACSAMAAMVFTASTGYLPDAVSPLSMSASVR